MIDKPWLLRALLVKGIIVPFRAPNSAKAYKSIWTEKGSPLIVISKDQERALKQELEEPVADCHALRKSYRRKKRLTNWCRKIPDLEEVIAIPMYPHYAMSSYETAVEYAKEQHQKGKYSFKLTFIKPFYDNADYIDALCKALRPI